MLDSAFDGSDTAAGTKKRKLSEQIPVYNPSRSLRIENAAMQERIKVLEAEVQAFRGCYGNEFSQMGAKLFANELKNGHQPKNNRRYDKDIIDFALSMCYHSGSAYERLRKVFCLPTTRTLRNHLSPVGCEPGILHNVIAQIKEDINNKKHTAECTLIFDETPLRSGVHWDPQTKTYLGKPTVTDDTKDDEALAT